jgi:hypothetical protein
MTIKMDCGPSAIFTNTSTNQPSAQSGTPQSSTPTSIPAASAPPDPTLNLGKTPLSGDTLKNASNDELSARSKNIKSEGKNLVSEYQSLDGPSSSSGETDEQRIERNNRKSEIYGKLTALDNESKNIKSEQKSRA